MLAVHPNFSWGKYYREYMELSWDARSTTSSKHISEHSSVPFTLTHNSPPFYYEGLPLFVKNCNNFRWGQVREPMSVEWSLSAETHCVIHCNFFKETWFPIIIFFLFSCCCSITVVCNCLHFPPPLPLPPQPNPPPSFVSPFLLVFVHASFILVPENLSPHYPLPAPLWLLSDCS